MSQPSKSELGRVRKPDEAWFEYVRRPGKLSARPVNAKGWAALMAAILAPLLILLAFLPSLRSAHSAVSIGFVVVVTTVPIGLLLKLAVVKGRPIG